MYSRDHNYYQSKRKDTHLKKMNSNKKIARIVGVLFITELVVHTMGSTPIEVILDAPDYLIKLAANKNLVITGVLLEVICAAFLLSIGAMMYPILKRHNKTAALGYFGFRIVETVLVAGMSIVHLLLFALSQEYVKAGAPDASHFQTLGALLNGGYIFSLQIDIIFYSLGCLMLYGLLFKAKLVPRFISVWGLIAVVLSLTGLAADMFGSNVGMVTYTMPLGLCQVFLAIWLIIKGFNSSAIAS